MKKGLLVCVVVTLVGVFVGESSGQSLEAYAVSAGSSYTCATLTVPGSSGGPNLYCWGDNSHGQLGPDSEAGDRGPIRIAGTDAHGREFSWTGAVIATEIVQSCAIDFSGHLYCWGNDRDEIRQGNDNGWPWTGLSLGYRFGCGTREAYDRASDSRKNKLLCWGDNGFGQLGTGNHNSVPLENPASVNNPLYWKDVSTGRNFSCGVSDDGKLYYWGSIGTGTWPSPRDISGGQRWKSCASHANAYHFCAINTSNMVYCGGSNDRGQLGIGILGRPTGSTATSLYPVVSSSNEWKKVLVGAKHTCGLKSGTSAATMRPDLYCWGNNANGQIGRGFAAYVLTPQLVVDDSISIMYEYEDLVSLGGQHTCAILNDHDNLSCWGNNSSGQLNVPTE